jgi:dihydrofolate reductase
MISIIVAVSENGVIGDQNTLPWQLSADLARFKKITWGHPIVMGRKTFESIGRILPGRENVIMTRQSMFHMPGCTILHSIQEIIEWSASYPEVFIIGGAQLYQECLSFSQKIYFTQVHAIVPGDVFFPKWNKSLWQQESYERFQADAKNQYDYSFSIFVRK